MSSTESCVWDHGTSASIVAASRVAYDQASLFNQQWLPDPLWSTEGLYQQLLFAFSNTKMYIIHTRQAGVTYLWHIVVKSHPSVMRRSRCKSEPWTGGRCRPYHKECNRIWDTAVLWQWSANEMLRTWPWMRCQKVYHRDGRVID